MTQPTDQRAARNGHRADCPLDHIAPPFASCACHLPENTPMTDEPEALEEAFKQIFGMGPYRLKDRGDEAQERIAYRFIAMLDCGAYLSAAEMLAPEGWCWQVTQPWHNNCSASVWNPVTGKEHRGFFSPPALALLGAIREARKSG